jgi:hypothetical protein
MSSKPFLCLFLFVAILAYPLSVHASEGVNMNLQKVWWNVSPPDDASLNALAQENQQRLGFAAADGFKLVRVLFPISWIEPQAPDIQRQATLKLVSMFVAQANAMGMKVIIALTGDSGASNKQDLVCREQSTLIQTVSEIAQVIPDSPMVGIEALNEPPNGCGGGGSWLAVQQQIYQTLRATKRQILLVVSEGEWGSLDGLLKFDPSFYRNDPGVLFSFHYYEPFLFTSQGSSNAAPGCYKYVHDLNWPYDGTVSQVEARALQALSEDGSVDDKKRNQCHNKLMSDLSYYQQTGAPNYADSRFSQVANWAQRAGIPPGRVFVGEIGVLRTQKTSGAPRPGAAGWLASATTAARRYGFIWAAYDLDSTFAIDCGQPPSERMCDEYRAALQ